ncbi:MAG: two-component regulator propeller domain-containing protein, partial [Verrucomicrobiota bacterium]
MYQDANWRTNTALRATFTWAPFANLKINALTPAKDGGIWIGTDRGIKYLDRSGILVRRVPASFDHLQIFSMVLDHDANLWAGTDQGLLRINRN